MDCDLSNIRDDGTTLTKACLAVGSHTHFTVSPYVAGKSAAADNNTQEMPDVSNNIEGAIEVKTEVIEDEGDYTH